MDVTTVKKLLKDTKREDLIKIIAKLATYDLSGEEWLLEYCSKHGSVSDKSMIIQKKINHYWSIAEKIIDDANDYGGTSDEEEGYDALAVIDELVEQEKTPWEFRRPIVDAMMEQFYRGNSGFEDALVDTCMILCQGKEEKLYLAEALTKGGNYYAGVASSIYLEYGEEEDFVAVKMANLTYGSDYIELANYYKKKKQYAKAISLVEEGLEKLDGRMDEVYEWLFQEYVREKQENKIEMLYKKACKKKWNVDTMVRLMYQYYANDYDKKKEYLIKMLEVCDIGQLRIWFDECKNVLTKEDFSTQSKHLYQVLKKRNLHTYLRVKIDEGYLQEVYEILQAEPMRFYGYGLDAEHSLTKHLADKYPVEICNRYWMECEGLCAKSSKKNYMQAVEILKEIRKILVKHKLKEEWDSAYAAFLEKNKRKSLLMGYIQAQKLH